MGDRVGGWYKVKQDDMWQCAFWNTVTNMFSCIDGDQYDEGDFEEIGDKIEMPE